MSFNLDEDVQKIYSYWEESGEEKLCDINTEDMINEILQSYSKLDYNRFLMQHRTC